MLFHKKTDMQRNKFHTIFVILGFLILGLSIWLMLGEAHQNLDAESVVYENILQTKIMWYKLKFSIGLISAGTLIAYTLFHLITHSPLGKCMWVYGEKDGDRVLAAKTLSMGVAFGSFIIGIFYVVSSIIGR
jgi:hypothetical protein